MKEAFNTPDSKTKTSVFYMTDIHCQIPKMERIVTGALQAGIYAENRKADFLKVSSGDTFIGADEKRNAAAASCLNIAGIDAQANGNHEFDITSSKCAELLKNTKTKILGMNMNFPENDKGLSKKVLRSYIHKAPSGEKYGLIGLQPSDINKRLKRKEVLEGITIDDAEQTKKELKEEVQKLKDQKIDKIFLLSHEGGAFDRKLAQEISGIDVIFSGHSHELIEDVKEGKNLFYSPEGEPVVVVQAGRDGNNFGVLNLEFDNKGRITYVQNNIMNTNDYKPNLMMTKTVNDILGESPVIGELKYSDQLPKDCLKEENPLADFAADALRTNLDADIVLINSANFRGSINAGKITERDITSIFPFANKLYKLKISEKDVVDAVKACGKSIVSKNSKPGLLQVSGLRYKLDKSGSLKEISYIDKNGQMHSINADNPDAGRYYTAVYDEFLIGGGDGLSMLKGENKEILKKYPYDKDKVIIDYIKSAGRPFEVRKDGRIQIV